MVVNVNTPWVVREMPEIHIAYSQRGYCTESGYRQLEQVLEDCRALYNAALQERRDAWRMNGVNVSWVDQNRSLTAIRAEWPDREGAVDRRVQRGVLRRVDWAYQAFFRRVRTGETPGFPRFQSNRRFRTIEVEAPTEAMLKVRDDGLKAWVKVKGLPCVKLRSSRPLPSARHLKTLRIVWKPTGIWVDLGFRVEREALPEKAAAVGIHMGVRNRMTLSTGELVERRRVDRSRESRLRQAVERSTKRDSLGRVSGPQSNQRAKRLRMLSRETERNARRNRNACHELTTAIVRKYGRIAVEKLNIRDMTRRARRPGPEAPASETRVHGDAPRPVGGGVSAHDGAALSFHSTYTADAGVSAHDGAAHTSWQMEIPEHDGAATVCNTSTDVNAEVPADDEATLVSARQKPAPDGVPEQAEIPSRRSSTAGRGAGSRNLNREILAQTWGLILYQLRYKAEWAGREFGEVDPRYVAQICSRCGLTGQRGDRRFTCPSCGFDCDVSLNAAENVLQRGFGLAAAKEEM